MKFTIQEISSISILVPAIAGMIKIQKADSVYRPFIFCIWIGLVNEAISFIIVYSLKKSNAVNANIYYLIESLLFIWFFKNLNLFRRAKVFYLLMAVTFTGWVINYLIISDIRRFTSYFVVGYSFTIVLLSITCINKLLVTKRNILLFDSVFLLCVAFIIYYSLSVLIEIFWLYGLNSSKDFRLRIYTIMNYVNVFTNLIYALAILWMPRRQEFTLPS